MLTHNFKIAFRNMLKYRRQTMISVIGLAVGLTCFALSSLWIRYEMAFDSFHENAEQIYVVYTPSTSSRTGYSRRSFNPLAAYLKETFPEVVNAAPVSPATRAGIISVDGENYPALTIRVDSSFFSIFDVKVLEGSKDFLIPRSNKLAITKEKARQLFGNENPIGKKINENQEICAIVSQMPKQSNYAFDIIAPFLTTTVNQNWRSLFDNTIIRLSSETNIDAFEKKLYEHNTGDGRGNLEKMIIKPITKIRYTDPEIDRDVKFQHILIFSLSGLLVVLCSLFNYLTLFVSRFRIRQKEFALRIVCGASAPSILAMLSTEFILTMMFAILLGCFFTQLAYESFTYMSDISMNLSAIYSESFLYMGGVILASLILFWLLLFIFQFSNLNSSIRRSNKKVFRKISIVTQLFISIGFAFCSIIILKQMHFLHNSEELGFSFKNRGSFTTIESSDVLASHLRQIPEIIEFVDVMGNLTLLPQSGRLNRVVSSWDEQAANAENISLELMFAPPEYINFYEFQLVAGEMLTDSDPESMVLLNESAVRAFGWHDPVGKHFSGETFGYESMMHCTVKGVIKHVHNLTPTMPPNPVCYAKPPQQMETARQMMGMRTPRSIHFKYHEGTWESCKAKIEQLKEEFSISRLFNDEEEYNKYLKSENALMKLLSAVSVICILICIFGFVSLVSLTCEERRKEIAIRKINGATVGNILAIFAKEYFLLLIIGAAIAFLAGYFIMQRWLENYALRTNIPAWIFFSIIIVLTIVIVLCVGWQVYRSSIENPAEVVKSE